MYVKGDRVFHLEYTQFNRTPDERQQMGSQDVDSVILLRFNELRFVFLNLWLNNIMVLNVE